MIEIRIVDFTTKKKVYPLRLCIVRFVRRPDKEPQTFWGGYPGFLPSFVLDGRWFCSVCLYLFGVVWSGTPLAYMFQWKGPPVWLLLPQFISRDPATPPAFLLAVVDLWHSPDPIFMSLSLLSLLESRVWIHVIPLLQRLAAWHIEYLPNQEFHFCRSRYWVVSLFNFLKFR